MNRGRASTDDLESWAKKLTASYFAYRDSATYSRVRAPAVEASLPSLLNRQRNIALFADIVRVAHAGGREVRPGGALGGAIRTAIRGCIARRRLGRSLDRTTRPGRARLDV